MSDASSELRDKIKATLIDELMLQEEADEIGDGMPLFGPDGLGLDSVDALQLVVALEKHFGLKIPDAEAAKEVLASVDSIAAEIDKMA
ncbi:MAG: acyl carrier protein [Verrucomicrobiales bacterium]